MQAGFCLVCVVSNVLSYLSFSKKIKYETAALPLRQIPPVGPLSTVCSQ